MLSMASVVIMGTTLNLVIIIPLNAPQIPPTTTAESTSTSIAPNIDTFGSFCATSMETMPARAATEPTEISIPPSMIT